MMKTMDEINAEKKTKSRPDLIPAAVLARFREALDDEPIYHGTYSALDAINALLAYADTEDLDELFAAMVAAASVRGSNDNILAMGRVMAYGYNKHGVCTWRVAGTEQADPQTHYASALRHLLEYDPDGDVREEGSGMPVLDHALAQMAILANLVMDPPDKPGENDGRWKIEAARESAALDRFSDWVRAQDEDEDERAGHTPASHNYASLFPPTPVIPPPAGSFGDAHEIEGGVYVEKLPDGYSYVEEPDGTWSVLKADDDGAVYSPTVGRVYFDAGTPDTVVNAVLRRNEPELVDGRRRR